MTQLFGWVDDYNLKDFVKLLAYMAGYALYDENYDWFAIEYGFKHTDADHDQWYSYPLIGTHALTLEVAQNVGASVVQVRVTSSGPIAPEVVAQWHLLIEICQEYRLTR